MAFRCFVTYLDLYVALRSREDLRDFSYLFDVLRVMDVIKSEQSPPCEISPQKALALYVSMQLSKWRYTVLRNFSLKEGLKYPSYYLLLKEKNECYPSKEDISVTETSVKIRLQSLLDLTVRRLIVSLKDDTHTRDPLVLDSKGGFDGASTQSVYHQSTSANDSDLATVFMASIVPLKLSTVSGITVWENDRPSSTAYCRPWWNEIAAFEAEITALTPTTNGNSTINHNLMLTMIDGKVHSIISETSAAVCDLCKARPVEMNDLQKVRAKPVNEDMYKYGLS
ncbi:unnamed protein product [Euphydryas editha]|uniref:Uncharacterized protein n=1 Tax=Euphydryas editha TaxID=104508 RepID=A0AAU9UBQ0_EUPED|nr:unnamed protein product [Euphydryas editha]